MTSSLLSFSPFFFAFSLSSFTFCFLFLPSPASFTFLSSLFHRLSSFFLCLYPLNPFLPPNPRISVCTPITQCNSTQFEALPPTRITDRVCQTAEAPKTVNNTAGATEDTWIYVVVVLLAVVVLCGIAVLYQRRRTSSTHPISSGYEDNKSAAVRREDDYEMGGYGAGPSGNAYVFGADDDAEMIESTYMGVVPTPMTATSSFAFPPSREGAAENWDTVATSGSRGAVAVPLEDYGAPLVSQEEVLKVDLKGCRVIVRLR